MQIQNIAFSKVRQFSDRDIHYQTKPEDFQDFIAYLPTETELIRAASDRKSFPVDRKLLKEVLLDQYKNVGLHPLQKEHIDLLENENTFTLVTAHQPCLFSGPLYYITKILSTVKLAAHLNKSQDQFRFVPVFINGSEDHDFDEIGHLNLFNKKVTWQTAQTGAIGRMSLEGIPEAIREACDILGASDDAQNISKLLHNSLEKSADYNEFVSHFVNGLLGHTGIVLCMMDDVRIKKAIMPIIKKEVLHAASQHLVVETQEAIESRLGYKPQAFARGINMFYMTDGQRARIEKEGDEYKVLDTDISFSEAEMEAEIESHPERFSPNVVIRPLMQEAILPNVAYVGGGGELAYWMERRSQFESFDLFYPCLIRRNSLMILSKSQSAAIEKLGLQVEELFEKEDDIIRDFLQNQTDVELGLNEEINMITKAMSIIAEKAEVIDPTLKPAVLAESSKIEKQIEQIESRIRRSLKKQEETQVNQIKNLKSKLFPGNGLQERTDNFLQYYVLFGPQIEQKLMEELNPLDKAFKVFIDK